MADVAIIALLSLGIVYHRRQPLQVGHKRRIARNEKASWELSVFKTLKTQYASTGFLQWVMQKVGAAMMATPRL